MGRRDRERIERIRAGLEDPIYRKKATSLVVNTIQKQSTDIQASILAEAISEGRLQNNQLRKSLEDNAPKEMRKGIAKLTKKGKVPTVDLLLEEYRREKSFQKLATSVGLDEAWFVQLAEQELGRFGEK